MTEINAPPHNPICHNPQDRHQDNRIKLRRAWLRIGFVTAERSIPCKQPACPTIDCGSEVTFKPLVPRWFLVKYTEKHAILTHSTHASTTAAKRLMPTLPQPSAPDCAPSATPRTEDDSRDDMLRGRESNRRHAVTYYKRLVILQF
ncbi:hypothetical protein J6590_078193 [Homalodisca vitripennis]|nr:hypothetical protein J6590_078193 [Homalodisca vitripennis]